MWHVEPIGFIRFGGENLKIIICEGFSIGTTFEDLGELEMERGIHYGRLKTTRMHFSIGIDYKF
jgi:hypothetical protein